MTKAKIFIVEDERIVSLALQRALGKLGYSVAGAEDSGEAAIQGVEATHPDLVLMDIQLRGELDGVAAAEQIRARHGLPVIYLTGYSDGETLSRAKVTEPSGYIIKPFEERELQIAIETALYKHATEARLKRVERWLSTTLRSIADAVVATDDAGKVTFLNPVAEELTGWKSTEALGRPLAEVCRLTDPAALPVPAEGPASIQETPAGRLVTRSGEEIAVERSIAPLRDEEGGDHTVSGSVLVFRDVTGREQLEAQLRQAQKLESVGRLAAGLAHDFNNLLTVIQGHTDVLASAARAGGTTGSERSLEGISQAVTHAAQLTRQLLTFSRQQCVQLRPLDVNGVVENIRGMIGRLLGASISVRFQPAAGLAPVQADPSMLEQVLMNLAVNARDAMPEGGTLNVRTAMARFDAAAAAARARPGARAGDFVQMEVTDTGCGMDAETLQRACEPFYTTKPVGQGTGLGLSTVFGIVQQHNGWLELESKPGRGTTCRVFLPAETAAITVTPLATADEGSPSEPGETHNETILLVEDEDSLRELVETMLKEAGYRVIAAASGVEALALWHRNAARIDLVLTDMIMPEGISGRQLAERLLESRPDLKIIYSSGYSLDLTDPQFAGGQRFHFLEKPYRSTRLLSFVRECLDATDTPPVHAQGRSA